MLKADVKLPNSDILLPKGSFVNTNLYSIMRSNWIDRPDDFIPERWASSNPQLSALKEMLIPFGHGKRSCIGMNLAKFQLRYVAANLVHYFDFELVGEPTFEYFLTLKPDELMMKFKERQL
jgi:cytochrome P450